MGLFSLWQALIHTQTIPLLRKKRSQFFVVLCVKICHVNHASGGFEQQRQRQLIQVPSLNVFTSVTMVRTTQQHTHTRTQPTYNEMN